MQRVRSPSKLVSPWLAGALGGFAFTALLQSVSAIAQAPAIGAQPVVQQATNLDSMNLNAALARLGRNPRDLAALLDAGNAALGIGDVDAANGFFTRADQVSPGNPKVKAGLASALVRSGNPFDAIPLFIEAEAGGGMDSRAALDRGLAYDLVADNAAAQRFYRQAVVSGSNDEAARRLALSLAIAGDKKGSEAVLSPLLMRQDKAAWRTRAFSLAILGQTDEAVAVINSTLPPALASGIAPYLRYMPRLTPAQQAAAANFGLFPRASEIGQDDPRIATLATNRKRPVIAGADASLVPQGQALGRREQTRESREAQRRREEAEKQRRRELAQAEETQRRREQAQAEAAARRRVEEEKQRRQELARAEQEARRARSARAAAPQPQPVRVAVAQSLLVPPVQAPAPVPAPMAMPVPMPVPVSLTVPPVYVPPSAVQLQTVPAAAAVAAQVPQPAPSAAVPSIPVQPPVTAVAIAVPRPAGPVLAAPVYGPSAPVTADVSQSPPVPVAAAPVQPVYQPPPPVYQPPPATVAAAPPAVPAASPAVSPAPASQRRSLADAFRDISVPAADVTPSAGAVDIRRIRPARQTEPAQTGPGTKGSAERPQAPSHPSRIWVQLATGRDKGALGFDFRRMTRQSESLFKGRKPSVSAWGQTNRLLTGPFESEAAANSFIGQLRRANIDGAFVWTSPAGQVVDALGGR